MEQKSDQTPAARYVVGFDLGTTNSAVCYVDTEESPWRVRTLSVPQLAAPSQIENRETLPSFHYDVSSGELPPDAIRLPFGPKKPKHAVGVFARDHGSQVAGRLISSAKSWLCHTGVDRTAKLLPWHGADDVERLSPLEASSRYLEHVRLAWDAKFRDHPLAEQDFVLTLPASFDEVARELTVKAAALAGLPKVVLIEEPQAAFYAWINSHREDWEQRVQPGQKILVVDVGGGTSDFTLIRVRSDSEGRARFHRVAVGDHLILGGDNLDLALAHHLEQKLSPNGKLPPRSWAVLLRNARQVKEAMLGPEPPEKLTVTIPGSGAKLLAGGMQVEVTQEEVRGILVDGFLPQVSLDAEPERRKSGFQEFGLPYSPDPAITKYLAWFLSTHRHVAMEDVEVPEGADPARPDIVLFNGGLFESQFLQQRMFDQLIDWFRPANDADWAPIVLDNDRLDLAVARGAAYYGMVRRGQGERINAALARTYYIGVEQETAEGESETSAVCLLPAGSEPGQSVVLSERPFDLLVGRPVEFPIFVSSTRLTDAPGEIVPFESERMSALPPIRTVLKAQRKRETKELRVAIEASLTEIGTLELWCREAEGRGRWRLQFDVRSATQTDMEAHTGEAETEGVYEEGLWEAIDEVLSKTFGEGGTDKPARLMKRLAEATDMPRHEWPPSLLRRMAERLMELRKACGRSQEHEARWLNLLGYSLRPGYGLAMDDYRVTDAWNRMQGQLRHATPMCRAEWWVLWRRIAGGLNDGQQRELANPLLKSLRAMHRQLVHGKGRGSELKTGTHEAAEIWRMLGSLELLSARVKTELGDMLIDLLPKRRFETTRGAALWAIGRIGGRCPMYGPLNTVVSPEVAERWIDALMDLDFEEATSQLAVMEIARRTDDRYRDISDKARDRAAAWLERCDAPEHYVELVREAGRLDHEEQGLVFGEALPMGLRLNA